MTDPKSSAPQPDSPSRDVTESRLQETRLREARLMLETVLNTIPVRVFWKDLDGIYLGCNLLFARDAGLERPEQLVGKTDHDMGWSEQAELYRAADREVTESGTPKLGYEEPQTNPTGEQIWLRTSKIPLRDLNGAVIGVLGTYEDITVSKRAEAEQRRLAAQLQHTQKLESLGILAGGIAHDFNNLLAAILGHADLALADMSGATPYRQHMEGIHTAAIRARELTNQMLAYSGKGRFVVRRLQLNDVVLEMGHLLQASIPKKVSVRYTLAEGLDAVEVDVAQIRQVVMNLMTNAAEACGDTGGLITVSTGRQWATNDDLMSTYLRDAPPDGEYIFLEISDDGCGIAADARTRLFEPFFTSKFQGRGLGLAAVLGIVRGHGGAIKVHSEPGKGSCFKVLLPVGTGAAPEQASSALCETTKETLSGTVLVVDDEDYVREVTRQMLERCGLSVMEAKDGVEALEVYRENREEISMVLLDMTMPRLNGDETFRELQSLDPDVQVMLASGYNEQDATTRFVGRGLVGFIQKPFTLADFTTKIREALALRPAADDRSP